MAMVWIDRHVRLVFLCPLTVGGAPVKTLRWTIGTFLLLSPLIFGCSMAQMTANMTVDVMWEASASVPEENDGIVAALGVWWGSSVFLFHNGQQK